MKMKVSVALATYNGEKFLCEQLDSIRLQSMPVDEVIISDDHSTDSTVALIQNYIAMYGLNHSWVLKQNPQKGVRENFYHAIKYTTGDVVLLCDQDDVWLPDKVEKIVQTYEMNKNVKCLNTSFVYIDAEGKRLSTNNDSDKANNNLILHPIEENALDKIPLSLVLNKNISPGMTMAVSREIVNQYLAVSERKVIHDWEINCIAAAFDGLYFLNCVLTKYRIHCQQTISIGNIRKRSVFEVLKNKVKEAEGSITIMQTIIAQLLTCTEDINVLQYLREMDVLCNERLQVVKNKRIFRWWREVQLFNKISKKYGNIDLRYCAIDLIAALVS